MKLFFVYNTFFLFYKCDIMLNYFVVAIIVFIVNLVAAADQLPKCMVGHNSVRSWSVDCSSLNLDYFPQYLLEHPVNNLSFTHNNLNTSVKFGVWKNLEYLNIAYNKLTYITNDTLSGLKDLKYLNVSFNELKKLDGDPFKNLPLLKILDISGNRDLRNDFVSVDNFLSGPLNRGINELYISNLDICDMNENLFDGASELSLIDLSNNFLTNLPGFPKSLKTLIINNNSLITLSLHPFYGSKGINTIILENNKNLTEVQSDTFHEMTGLKYISFRGCSNLDNIYYGTFYHNHKLKYLSIANCNFTTLPTILKPIFLRINNVDLQDNPWHCNVAIKWFYLLKIPKNMTENLRCALPTEVPLLEFFGPKHHHEILKVILGVLVIFVFIFFGVGLFFAYEMERKKKLAHPYMPLGRGTPVSSPIYISTVV